MARMKLSLAVALLFGAPAVALADCPVADIEKALNHPLDNLKKTELQVTDIQSTEGGVWRIYERPDGTLDTLVRIDAGESGMGETRLAIVNDAAYGIARTRVDYLRHAFIDNAGPNGTAKRTTEYFYFCGGKLYLPPDMYATLDNGEYAKSGDEWRRRMLLDKDVAALTRSLTR
jgi:hypothetical protein